MARHETLREDGTAARRAGLSILEALSYPGGVLRYLADHTEGRVSDLLDLLAPAPPPPEPPC